MSKNYQALYNRDAALDKLVLTQKLAQSVENDTSVVPLFKVRHRFLNAHYDEFRLAHQAVIKELSSGKEFEDAEAKSKKADEAYFTALAIFEEMFPESRSITPTAGADSELLVTQSNNSVKLPKLTLPTFDGNLKNWSTFRDMFDSLIHKNSYISNVEKFQYLVSSLSGVPLNIVSALPISHDNYAVAYDLLVKRYQNKRALAAEHWRLIQNAPCAVSESAESLQKIIDTFTKNLSALDLLGFTTKNWDFVLFNLLLDKLDMETKKSFEKEYTKTEVPTYEQLKSFVLDHSSALARVKRVVTSKPLNVSYNNKIPTNQRVVKSHAATINERNCAICKQMHYINQCPTFIQMTPKERYQKIKELKLCHNCFKGHFVKVCPSKFNCKHCKQRHHSLLHFEFGQSVPSTSSHNNAEVQINSSESPSLTVLANNTSVSNTLLATVIVKVRGIDGKLHACRCLLDSGSQSHFIRDSFASKIGVIRTQLNFEIQGISQSSLNVSSKVEVNLYSTYMDFHCQVSCLVLPHITANLPAVSFDRNALNIPSDIVLADNQFNISKQVDMLIGAGLFWHILMDERRSLGKDKPILQETKFGWIASGPLISLSTSFVTSCNVATNKISDELFTKFWKIEEPEVCVPIMSIEERECENHFERFTIRNSQGRFVVHVPFKDTLCQLGDSRESALRRFNYLENRLRRSPELRAQYVAFMSEYISLNHMTEVHRDNSSFGYYIPHHAVVKDSISTKLRVVFDASMKTNSGVSLNNVQLVGPVVQSDLLSIILRFRQYSFVLAGDIKMMYRQILISPEHRKYQRIFWRSEPSEELKVYELNTVTYGTASAPYLATKCIQQLSKQYHSSHPTAAHVIANDFYVDDLLTGSNCFNTLVQIRKDVCNILKSAQFELRKLMSNNSDILKDVAENTDLQVLHFGENENSKTLGVCWNSNKDQIRYIVSDLKSSSCKATKRNILSIISSIFDPLGLVSPVIVKAKLLMQNLWECKIGWDDIIPERVQLQWFELRDTLNDLNSIQIPRHAIVNNPVIIELHGFCDASEKAYGACVYIRSIDTLQNIAVHLLISKSKVAPLRKLTLPRLELCGAVLLVKLSRKVLSSMPQLNISKQYFWCDSTIAIHWIKGSPTKWKTFVANRVANIQEHTNINQWFHVESKNNPADIISRGAIPSVLANSSLWWHGPLFLKDSQIRTESLPNIIEFNKLPEVKLKNCCLLSFCNVQSEFDIFKRFSKYDKLIRIVGYTLRWKYKVIDKVSKSGALTAEELHRATISLVKLAQMQSFASEIHALKLHGKLDTGSKILSLHPFLDENEVLRVGGRLHHSSFEYDTKHPILLSHKHILTELIIEYEHVKALHCGPLALLYAVRQRFWPTNGRHITRKTVRKCVKCFRVKPYTNQAPLMGNLPSCRVSQGGVFIDVGIDYAGHFLLKTHKLRNPKLIKCYIALFICMTTKAIHLEAVTELTSEAFIATFRRFVSRRGKPKRVYSDNGTNFVGANKEIKQLNEFLSSIENQNKITNTFNIDGIAWHFIPSSSPTFGGLWESGVKLTKHHLRRVLKNVHVTFEDFSTILAQVEAVLNSRPLSPLSSDPNDYNPLTPGHFLIGRPLNAIPDNDYTSQPENRLKHFHRLQQIVQHFWARWCKEYINHLQIRQKWRKNHQTLIKEGSLVVVKDDGLPPLKWQLARVLKLHQGSDKICRVVTLKTNSGVIKRAINKICVLPFET